jgi:hypothetical protein
MRQGRQAEHSYLTPVLGMAEPYRDCSVRLLDAVNNSLSTRISNLYRVLVGIAAVFLSACRAGYEVLLSVALGGCSVVCDCRSFVEFVSARWVREGRPALATACLTIIRFLEPSFESEYRQFQETYLFCSLPLIRPHMFLTVSFSEICTSCNSLKVRDHVP